MDANAPPVSVDCGVARDSLGRFGRRARRVPADTVLPEFRSSCLSITSTSRAPDQECRARIETDRDAAREVAVAVDVANRGRRCCRGDQATGRAPPKRESFRRARRVPLPSAGPTRFQIHPSPQPSITPGQYALDRICRQRHSTRLILGYISGRNCGASERGNHPHNLSAVNSPQPNARLL